MTDSLGLAVSSASGAQEVVEGSDVVICIAAATEPVVDGEWLASGVTLIGAGPTTWRIREVDDAAIVRADKIFVDSVEQARDEAGDMASAVDRGLLQWSQLLELRHAVAGTVSGRDNHNQIVFAKMMGTGVADVAAAKLAYDKAIEMGLGTEMEW
jgi:ornithine cyclodeaminase/alanine dehydrogenase-like protein (mu-crystallin family)